MRYLAEGGRKVGISGPLFLAENRAAETCVSALSGSAFY
jgi:hypothetical protein